MCEIEKAIAQSQLRTHFISVDVSTGLKLSQMPPSQQETRRDLFLEASVCTHDTNFICSTCLRYALSEENIQCEKDSLFFYPGPSTFVRSTK